MPESRDVRTVQPGNRRPQAAHAKARRRPARSERMRCPCAMPTTSTVVRCATTSTACSACSSGWAVSGAPSASSGRCRRVTTAVGYAGGYTPNPTYREVCSGQTGHAEVVLVVFDPARSPTTQLLQVFWESHDPTQGMRQGNDAGTQYRSAIYCRRRRPSTTPPSPVATLTRAADGSRLRPDHHRDRLPAPTFYYAEDEHRQYLAKNPTGYCGIGGTGVSCPVGTSA